MTWVFLVDFLIFECNEMYWWQKRSHPKNLCFQIDLFLLGSFIWLKRSALKKSCPEFTPKAKTTTMDAMITTTNCKELFKMVIGGGPIEHGAGVEKSLLIAEEAGMMPHERGRGGKRTKHLHCKPQQCNVWSILKSDLLVCVTQICGVSYEVYFNLEYALVALSAAQVWVSIAGGSSEDCCQPHPS